MSDKKTLKKEQAALKKVDKDKKKIRKVVNLLSTEQIVVDNKKEEAERLKFVFQLVETIQFYKKILQNTDDVNKRYEIKTRKTEKISELIKDFSRYNTHNRKVFIDLINSLSLNQIVDFVKSLDTNLLSTGNLLSNLSTFIKDNDIALVPVLAPPKINSLAPPKIAPPKINSLVPVLAPPKINSLAPPKIVPIQSIYTQCLKAFYDKPWIPAYSGIFYVSGKVNGIDIVNWPEFVFEGMKIVYNNSVFYKAKKSLDTSICSGIDKKQKGKVLSFVKDDKIFELNIVYKKISIGKTQNYIENDESIFKNESKWFSDQGVSLQSKIKRILNEKIKGNLYEEEILDICLTKLKLYIKKKEDAEKFINLVYKETEDQTIQDFLFRVGGILIYVDDYYDMDTEANKFKTQIKINVYNTSNLFSLTSKDILRDVYINQKMTPELFTELSEKISKNLSLFAYTIVRNLFSLERSDTITTTRFKPDKVFIHNQQDLICNNNYDSSEWDTIIYKESSNIYCFKLLDLITQINSGNFINKYTGNPFSKEFIEEIKNNYLEYEETQPVLYQQEYSEDEKEEKSYDISMIFNDINQKELSLLDQPGRNKEISNYYKYFVLNSKSSLEKKLNKTKEDLERIQNFIQLVI